MWEGPIHYGKYHSWAGGLGIYKPPVQVRRDGSEVKSIDCFSRPPEFYSQQPYGSSQASMRFDALFLCAGKHADRTPYT